MLVEGHPDPFFGLVPSGASTGQHEAVELRDGTNKYMGKSVFDAVKNVNDLIFKELENLSIFDQSLIDSKMINLDNTPNKSKLGANAILSVSLAVSKAAALEKNIPLILDKMAWNKSMRWNNYNLNWARPLKSILAVFDSKYF